MDVYKKFYVVCGYSDYGIFSMLSQYKIEYFQFYFTGCIGAMVDSYKQP